MSEKSEGAAMSGESNGKAGGEGRDSAGRFTAGNGGGPGNPFARKTAAMRKAIQDAVTAEDLAAITAAMIQKARDGDVGAAKLVFTYCAGRPGPTPDPDTLDAHDLAVRRENTASPADMAALFEKLPAGTMCAIAAAAAPHVQDRHEQTFLDGLRKQGEREKKRRKATPTAAGPRPGPKAGRAPAAAEQRAPAPTGPGPAGTPDPHLAELLRSLPSGLLDALSGPEVNPCRLVTQPDCKRDNPHGPEVTTAAQAGRGARP